MVHIGHVLLMIWWNGTETMARETFDMAIFTVNRSEKARRVRFSRLLSCDSLRKPRPNMVKHPMDVAEQCTAVSNQGNWA
jgi:hypothetical protein